MTSTVHHQKIKKPVETPAEIPGHVCIAHKPSQRFGVRDSMTCFYTYERSSGFKSGKVLTLSRASNTSCLISALLSLRSYWSVHDSLKNTLYYWRNCFCLATHIDLLKHNNRAFYFFLIMSRHYSRKLKTSSYVYRTLVVWSLRRLQISLLQVGSNIIAVISNIIVKSLGDRHHFSARFRKDLEGWKDRVIEYITVYRRVILSAVTHVTDDWLLSNSPMLDTSREEMQGFRRPERPLM